jgi:hypothetical protein
MPGHLALSEAFAYVRTRVCLHLHAGQSMPPHYQFFGRQQDCWADLTRNYCTSTEQTIQKVIYNVPTLVTTALY